MFPATISQLAEMGREATQTWVWKAWNWSSALKKRRMRQYWAPTIGERQLNPTFIFNSAWEVQIGDVRKQESNDSLQRIMK
jgi:hypothetical protein